jgi:hypothetical protein
VTRSRVHALVCRAFVHGAMWWALAGCAAGCGKPAPPPDTAANARFGKSRAPLNPRAWLDQKGEAEVLTVEGGVAGDRIQSLLEVPETDCAIAIARGTPSVDDVDLFAYGEDGAVLGSDEGSDKAPALLVCPPHPRRVMLVARIAAGHGLVAIGAQRVAVSDSERAAAAYGVRFRPGEIARRMTVWPGLDERLEEHRRRIGGAWTDVRRVAVPLDARTPTRLSAAVEAERCLDVLISPSDEVTALDATVLDQDGRILGRTENSGRDRSVIVCSPTPAAITLELRPHAGIGLAVVMMSRSREGTESDIDVEALRLELFATAPLAEERKRRGAALTAAGYDPGRVLVSGSLPLGQRLGFPLELPKGCVRLDWVGGTPLRGVNTWLYAPDGSLLASADGAFPVLFRCGQASSARLDAEALSRPGPFVLELRPERGTPPLLDRHPLAASRLLGRMVERGVITSSRRVGAVYAHELSNTAIARQNLTLPFRRCLDVTLAIGAGAEMPELRLLRRDGTEVGLSRGSTATSVRACALDASTGIEPELIAEMRVASGRATGLLTAHLFDPLPAAQRP